MLKISGLAGAGCIVAVLAATPAFAGPLSLQEGERWLAIASSKDRDTAIGIAGLYAQERAKVASTQSGWYAVILGPYREGSISAITAAHPNIGAIPADSLLSRGDKYVDRVWEEKPWEEQRVLASYEVGKPVQFAAGDITFAVTMAGDEDNPGPTTATATSNGNIVFTFATPNEYSMFGSDAGLVKLDPATSAPQLVFTRFTGGAHCCTQTWIATAPEAGPGWTLIDAGVLDGGGYSFEDVDGDGTHELVNVDNSFLYAFDSYAGSFAPIRISRLRGNVLTDISGEENVRGLLKRDLARMEFAAKLNGDLWKSNGFLAGWVAAKQRLGQGEDAWQTALENLDQNSDFGPQVCKSGKPVEDCPFDDLEAVPIAKALAQFLAERDYGELPPKARALIK